jgi:hypothetical protein
MIGDCNNLTQEQQVEVIAALKWLGMPLDWIHRIDICEDGSVYVGLTQILPPGTIK